MRCAWYEELISADLDGEVDHDERVALEHHLAGCAACSAYRDDLVVLHRAVRIAPAPAVPDLTDAILEQAGVGGPSPAAVPAEPASRPRRSRGPVRVLALQYALLVVALTIATLAVPELLASSGIESVHTSRHLGGWDLAFAVGLVLAALQPWRARGLVPMAAALGGVMVVTAAVDVSRGLTPGLAEGSHLLELLGLLFLWLLAREAPEARPGRGRTRRPAGGSPTVVDRPSAPTGVGPGQLRSLLGRLRPAPGVPAPVAGRAAGAAAEAADPARRAA